MGENQPLDTKIIDTATSCQIEAIDNPLFTTDKAESQLQSSISFTPKRMHKDDIQIIPQPATATSHGEVPSTSGCQQDIINEHARVNQGKPLSRVELWLRATPNTLAMTTT